MPIPYYDKDQEDNFTEMHDESESYPDDVGIISWQDNQVDESGNKKFTVLLDTTLEMLIKKREKMMDKIGDVIDFFEKSDNLSLIWRPHPLIESTLRNMYSELIPIYIKLVERCKKTENCIFDDTDDMHTAMAWSDAFMGKYGSMIELYRVTTKPTIMLEIGEKTNFESDGIYDEEGLKANVSKGQVIREKDYGLGNLIDFSMKYQRDEVEYDINQMDGKKIYDFAIKAAKMKMN